MRVVVTGATGFIGSALVQALQRRGDTVVVLTRSAAKARERLGPTVEVHEWRPPDVGPWIESFGGADAVINLAGEPVAPTNPLEVLSKRWTVEEKARIRASRVDPTRAVVEAIRQAEPRPRLLINQSAIGYYGDRGDMVLTEGSAAGDDFLARVVADWEEAARPVGDLSVRLVLMRTGIVLGRDGGALPMMALPFRLFAGGTVGDPRQWVSWIHLEDQVGLILYALEQEQVQGVVNATAPNPVTMQEFSRGIGRALHRPTWVPLMGKALRIGLGEQAQSILASQRVIPQAAESFGYRFRYPGVTEALRAALGNG